MTQSCHQPENSSCGHTKKFDFIFWGSFSGVAALFIFHSIPESIKPQISQLDIMSHTAYSMLSVVWWGVVIGAIFVGILSKIPRHFVIAILGRGGTASGLLRAAGAGVLLDLCSHGILMVGVKLYERGASAGQIITFLLSSPWNSFSLTLILIGLIGFQMDNDFYPALDGRSAYHRVGF